MKSLEITVETCLAKLDSLIGSDILDSVVTTETVLCVQFKPPPPGAFPVEYLRQEFEQIEFHFSGKSLEIMRCILATDDGKIHREKLKAKIWEKYPANPRVRRAIHRLNVALAKWGFGYTLQGNLKGSKSVYRFVPIEK